MYRATKRTLASSCAFQPWLGTIPGHTALLEWSTFCNLATWTWIIVRLCTIIRAAAWTIRATSRGGLASQRGLGTAGRGDDDAVHGAEGRARNVRRRTAPRGKIKWRGEIIFFIWNYYFYYDLKFFEILRTLKNKIRFLVGNQKQSKKKPVMNSYGIERKIHKLRETYTFPLRVQPL